MLKVPRREMKEFRLVLWADPAEFDTDPAKTTERLLELALRQIPLTIHEQQKHKHELEAGLRWREPGSNYEYEGELEDPKDGVFNSWGNYWLWDTIHVKMPSDK